MKSFLGKLILISITLFVGMMIIGVMRGSKEVDAGPVTLVGLITVIAVRAIWYYKPEKSKDIQFKEKDKL